MAEKKFFVDINLQGSDITNLKADTLDITSNLASANTKRIVYWSGQYYYSNGTSWIALGNTESLPAGGATGDILAKASGTDYDVEWISNYTSTVQHEVKAGVALTKGQAVYVSSANGANMIVSKASNASEATSSKTMGLVASSAALNDIIFVITEGLLTGTGGAPLDTSTATEGDPVWLGTNGNLIFGLANKPVAPAHLVFLGIVTRSSTTVGEIFVKVQNGFELGELHNVDALNALNNDGLFYNTTTSLWEHKSIATALGYTPENVANKSTSTSLGTSDTLYPTQNAVKVYTDNILGNSNALVYKGTIDCSTNPDYPTADAGWMYIASVAGKIGGASGTDVEVGDMIICNTDGTVSGNQATVGQYWNVIQKNIVGAVTGPASSVNNTVAVFDGTTGKVIKQGIITDTGTNVGIGTNTPNAKLDVVGTINNTISGQTLSTSYNSPVNRLDINSNVNLGFQAGASGGIFFYVDGSATNRSLWLHPSSAVLIGNPTATSPNATLHVTNVGTPNSFLVEDSDNPDGTPFVIDANGNVGMGTLTPQNVLHVKANLSSSGTSIIRVESDASTANASISYYSGGVHRWEVGTGVSLGAPYEIYDRVAGQTRFQITTSGASVFSNGNVGIGTETPAAKLSVLKGSQSDTISVANSAAWIGGVDAGLAIGQSASAPYGTWLQSIRPSDDATFPLLLNPSGSSVGIGITVPLATLHTRTVAVPSAGETVARFDVSDDTSSYLRIYNSTTVDASFVPTLEGKNSAATVALGFIGNATSDTGNEPITIFDSRVGNSAVVTRPLFQWNNFGATRMTILANGNLGLGVTNPTTKLEVNGDVKISTIANATIDTDKFLVSDSGVIKYRTGAELLSDILTLTTTSTNGPATLTGNTLNIPVYESSLIPKMSGNEIWRGSTFRNNSTTTDTTGGLTFVTPTGTATARSVATTSYATRSIRMGIVSSSTTVGRYTGIRGSVLLWYVTGGFLYTGEFNISDTAFVTGTHNFWGLASSTSDLLIGGVNNDQPSALTNIIAFANDSGDGNLQIMHNDASGTATKTDLGSSFPSNRTAGAAITTIYSCYLYNAPNSSDVIYRIVNKETGAVAQGTLSTNLPASTVGLNFFGARTMGTPLGGVNNSGQFDVYRLGVYSL